MSFVISLLFLIDKTARQIVKRTLSIFTKFATFSLVDDDDGELLLCYVLASRSVLMTMLNNSRLAMLNVALQNAAKRKFNSLD